MTKLRPETLAAKAGYQHDPATGAVVPPIHLATTYARDADVPAHRRARLHARRNPTFVVAEELLAALEGGAAALVHASGMAAATAVFRAWLRPGEHAIVPRAGYFALRNWLHRVRRGLGRRGRRRRYHRPRRGRGRAASWRDPLVWIEIAREPDVGGHRHRRSRRARARGRRAPRGRLDVRDAGAHAAARARRRPRHALGDEVPRGSLRRARRRARHRAPPTRRGRALAELRHDEGACSARSRRACSCAGCARCSRGSSAEQDRAIARDAARRARPSRSTIRGSPSHPQHAIAARQMTARVRQHAVDQVGGAGSDVALGAIRQARAVGAGDLARRRREPRRAPTQRRRPRHADARRSPAALGRPRARGRSVRAICVAAL